MRTVSISQIYDRIVILIVSERYIEWQITVVKLGTDEFT